MKNVFLSIVALIMAVSASAQKKGMVVIKGVLKGDLKGYNKIYCFTRTTNDSAMIDENGNYTFKFPFTEPKIKMLYPDYVKSMRQMYQPFGILVTQPGTYYVNSDIGQGMYASSKVKGVKDAVLYRNYEQQQGEAYSKINYAISDLYGAEWYKIEETDAKYKNVQQSRDSLNNAILIPLMETLIKKNPDSYVSAFVLSASGREIGSLEKKEALLAMLSPKMRKSEAGKKYADYIQGLKNSKIGNTVENFILSDPFGKDVDFASFNGKYVLIDFWASWCAPCRKSFPHMREVYKTFKNDPFEIYSISIDEDKASWLKALAEEQNPWPQTLDTKNISQSGFAVTGVPSTFLIDPKGKIIAKEVGFDPNGNSAIEQKLVELFGKKVGSQKDASKEPSGTIEKERVIKAATMTGM